VTTLAEATTPAADGTLVIAPGWRQGRGAFGGLTIAAAIRAIELRVADPRRLVRSVTAELPGPTVVGTARFAVEILRSGSSVTVARAALEQNGDVTTHAVAILAATRDAGDIAWRELAMPQAPDWRTLHEMPWNEQFPEFSRHFAYRIVAGIPFRRDANSTLGWIAAREPGAPRDAAYIAALMDAWFPAVLVRIAAPRPLATIAYTLEIVDGLDGLDPAAPLLYRGTVPVAANGYFLETRELWGSDGRLVALNHQTFAVIR